MVTRVPVLQRDDCLGECRLGAPSVRTRNPLQTANSYLIFFLMGKTALWADGLVMFISLVCSLTCEPVILKGYS